MSECVQKLHQLLKGLLLLSSDTNNLGAHPTARKVNPWNIPIERFLALYSLEEDGSFKAAEKLTKLFAALHYHIRGVILYEVVSTINSNVDRVA
jgi:hypothetical protein